ncbi:MAG: TonB family protein [Bernardetiaceae bacterium]|nr:TonB family protein [Bernardetiaceae bacterium]
MNVGLILSLAITWTVFNWNFADGGNLMDLGTPPSNQEEAIDIPQTVQAEPPPPKQIVQDPEIVEVEDDVELEDEVEIETEVEVPDVSDIVTDVVSATPGVVKKEEKEDSNEIFDIVEEAATPVGGMEAFYEYVSKEIKYPKQAKRMQVQGKVFVVFVVEKDGSLTQVEVLKGIGAGCDEEALRVIKNAPKWNPAKQRGRAVRTRIRVPITFRLRS